jgi:hypothetical protein
LTVLLLIEEPEGKAMSSKKILAIALAGLMGALWHPSTARAQSVTPERALLNRSATTSWSPTRTVTHPVFIDGERALLNRFQTIVPTPLMSAEPVVSAPIDGVKALLNRSGS